MSLSITQVVPTIAQAQSITELLTAIIFAAAKGIKVYITATAYARLKPLFDKLGIPVREVGKIADPSYVLIKVSSDKVKIIVYDNNTKIVVRTTSLSTFEKTLTEIIEKAKGRPTDVSSGKYYELVLSEVLKALEVPDVNSNGGDNDEH